MNPSMRALVFTAPGEVRLLDVPRPDATPGTVVLDVRAAGICGSELHGFRHTGFRTPPLIMGHEFAGITPDGRRVVAYPLVSCGLCDLCRRGRTQICRNRRLLGAQLPGGFAEQVAIAGTALHELPPDMSWQRAAMVEPLANAVHAWRQAGDDLTGDRVAIVGAGTIGLVSLLVARRLGLGDITVVDRSPDRLALAARLGAATCADALTGEYDVVLDAVGAQATRAAAMRCVRPGGTAVWVGLAESPSAFDGNDLVRFEKRVVGSFAYTQEEFAEALALAPSLDLGWTTPVPLTEARDVFMSLANGAPAPVKAVIMP